MESLIRPMKPTDLDQVYAIELQCQAFPWTKGIISDCIAVGYSCWVIETEGLIVGFAIMIMQAGESHILNVCIAPNKQGQGLGRRMMAHLIDVAKRAPIDIMFLEVRKSNLPAITLYRSLGFNEIGIRKDYYQTPQAREDAIMFALQL